MAAYFVAYVLIPKFLYSKRILLFVVTLAFTLLVASFFQRLFHSEIIGRFFEPEEEYFTLYPTTALVFKTVISIYPVVVIVALIKILKHWYEEDRKHQLIQKEKVEAELNFLKSQMNPHFLFNTLNSLYALTLKKSDQASKVVLKLSQLLDYLIYDSNKKIVPLKNELDHVQTYISLEKIRFGDRLNLNYEEIGDTSCLNVPPLLILPFVENCFKHGAAKSFEEVWVNIKLTIENDFLHLKFHNSKELPDPSFKKLYDGIGLQNVKRRLELIYGKGNYEMRISDAAESFLVELTLKVERDYKENKDEANLLYH